jgi:Ca2+-binding RTX toxin-like protein
MRVPEFNQKFGTEAGEDLIGSTIRRDQLYGFGGNDRLYANGGDDQLYGGAGNDLLDGGTGADVMYGEGPATISIGSTILPTSSARRPFLASTTVASIRWRARSPTPWARSSRS